MIWEKLAAERLDSIEKPQKDNKALKEPVKERGEKRAPPKKHATNSSKPPSSDITKPPKQGGVNGEKRTHGAPKGPKKHERPPFSAEQIDTIIVP